MDNFKISLFESEHNKSFPSYETLTELECRKIIDAITKKYGVNALNIEEQLASRQSFYEDTNALDGFILLSTLKKLEIEPLMNIYINWYQFKRIDTFKIEDLDKYFYDIWFPSSDDIDLFDGSLSWILSIRHDGCISYIKYVSA